MNTDFERDWLDNALSRQANYIDDDGFTDAVMCRLPPRKTRHKRAHAVILAGAGLLSLLVPVITVARDPARYTRFVEALLSQPLPMLGLLSVTLCVVSALLAGWFLRLDQ